MLNIKNLSVDVDKKVILDNLNLNIGENQTHIIMGVNGSGKSSLLNTIVKNPKYNIKSGDIVFNGQSLNNLSVSDVARKGIFLSFQNPPSVPGLSISNLLKYSVNSVRRANDLPALTAPQFFQKLREFCEVLNIPLDWVKRDVNLGFSGGEKKRISMLEMLFLQPKLALLDEPDSGVDVDSVNIIIKAISILKESKTSFIIVSHYPQLISNVSLDEVHIMKNGSIVKSGDRSLADMVLKQGFENV